MLSKHHSIQRDQLEALILLLVKLTFIQYTFGIRSMRKKIEEAETNMTYRWFLGYGSHDKVPPISTLG